MCIAIVKPEECKIDYATLQQCWKRNPDGAGFMYIGSKTGLLRIEKPFFNFADFWKQYCWVQQNNASIGETVIHFRISTSGKDDKLNTHPHRVNENVGFVHNGILRNTQRSACESDTVTLNKYGLQKLPENFLHYPGILELLAESSHGSKLVFLDAETKRATIIHEDAGVLDKGIWYSNSTYKTPISYGTKTTSTYLISSWDSKYPMNEYTRRWDSPTTKWLYIKKTTGFDLPERPKSKRQKKREAKAAKKAELKKQGKENNPKKTTLAEIKQTSLEVLENQFDIQPSNILSYEEEQQQIAMEIAKRDHDQDVLASMAGLELDQWIDDQAIDETETTEKDIPIDHCSVGQGYEVFLCSDCGDICDTESENELAMCYICIANHLNTVMQERANNNLVS